MLSTELEQAQEQDNTVDYSLCLIEILFLDWDGSYDVIDGPYPHPGWYDDEVGASGHISWVSAVTGDYRFDFKWMITNDVQPGDRLTLKLEKPRYYRSGGFEYPDEWDADYSASILSHARHSGGRIWRAVKACELYLKHVQAARNAKNAHDVHILSDRENWQILKQDMFDYDWDGYPIRRDGCTYRLMHGKTTVCLAICNDDDDVQTDNLLLQEVRKRCEAQGVSSVSEDEWARVQRSSVGL